MGSGEAATLLDQVEGRIFSACGIPPGLGGGATSGQAVSSSTGSGSSTQCKGCGTARGRAGDEARGRAHHVRFNQMGHIPHVERATAIARLIKMGKMTKAEAMETAGLL